MKMVVEQKMEMHPKRLSECSVNLVELYSSLLHRWEDEPGLTWKLLTNITDNSVIRMGLYPGPGGNASTQKGGGKNKTEHHWNLAVLTFGDHSAHKDTISKVGKAARDRKPWCMKVKNRLTWYVSQGLCNISLISPARLEKKTSGYIKDMGETGAGLENAQEIQEDTPLWNKWRMSDLLYLVLPVT
jgi:hypothetical protein